MEDFTMNAVKDKHLATKLVETARGDKGGGYVNLPLYHASTHTYESVEEYQKALAVTHDYGREKYARMGTPPVIAFEKAMSELEGGFAARATSSGLSALTTALFAVTQKDGHILLPDSCYPSTVSFCENFLKPKLGVKISYYSANSATDAISKFRENTCAVFIEAPSSYAFEIGDLETIVSAAREAGILTIADNTWSGSVFFQPLKLGCDISVVSASKYICGHSDAMLGIVISNEQQFEKVRLAARMLGQNPAPDAVFLALRGLRTLELRLKQHQKGAIQVARWLQQSPAVAKVLCPALEDNPNHEMWNRYFTGCSGLFGIQFSENIEPQMIYNFIDDCKLFRLGSSWGGFESLIIPAFSNDFPSNHIANSNRLCRIHIGLEDPEDLISDLKNSFNFNFEKE
jgi:cystathionine beta-lyase